MGEHRLDANRPIARLQLLGAVEISRDGVTRDMGPPRQQCVLTALAMELGHLVPMEVIISRVWGEAPPTSARRTLYAYIAKLKRVLAEATGGTIWIERKSGGYVLKGDRDIVDALVFEKRLGEAASPHLSRQERSAVARSALSLWKDHALVGLDGSWAAQVRDRLRQRRLEATLIWAEHEVDNNPSAGIVAELSELATEYPYAESLMALLMKALCACGREAEALQYYARSRERLIEDLGVEPGAELSDLHTAILRRTTVQTSHISRRSLTPAQLPAETARFVGRAADIGELNDFITSHPSNVVVVISGSPGVGKTALATRWARLIANKYPDGQLFVNLRGFQPSGHIMTAGEVLRGFLVALNVSPATIPVDIDAQIGLCRTLVSEKRMLFLLDNVRDAAPVIDILPSGGKCLTIITSRNELTELVVRGAYPMKLDLMPTADSVELIRSRVGDVRVAQDPDATARLIGLACGLPLALSIIGARAVLNRHLPLAKVADELQGANNALDALGSLRDIFSWSYQLLSPAAARLFRLIGCYPSPDIGVVSCAALMGTSFANARLLLGELCSAHLVQEQQPGRFSFHDLLRAFAWELSQDLDETHVREQAQEAALDTYVHTSCVAAQLISPHRMPIEVGLPIHCAEVVQLATQDQAMAWYMGEHQSLLPMMRYADTTSHDSQVWQLAWAWTDFLQRCGDWETWRSTQEMALASAERRDNVLAEAGLCLTLARNHSVQGRLEAAMRFWDRAGELFIRLGDRQGEAAASLGLGWVLERLGRFEEAIESSRRSLELYRAIEHHDGEARALNSLGSHYSYLGNHLDASEYCRRAITLLKELGDMRGESDAWDSLAFAHQGMDQPQEAINCYRKALEINRFIGDRFHEAEVLARMSDVHFRLGDTAMARQSLTSALEILNDLGHSDAGTVRAKLDAWSTSSC